MKNRLKKLFDYQRFSQNSHLEDAILSIKTEEVELMDEELFAVAGGKHNEQKSGRNDDTSSEKKPEDRCY